MSSEYSRSSRRKSPSKKRKAPKNKSAEALSSPTKTVVCKNFIVKKFKSIKNIFRKKDTSTSSSSTKTCSSKRTPRSARESIKSEKSSRPDPNLAIERWITHCFGSNMITGKDRMNTLFAPVPSLEAYVAMLVAMRSEQRKVMKGVFFVNEEYCEFVAARLKKQKPLPPHEAHHLFRLITDDSEDTLVNEKYIKMMQDYFGPTTLVCCRPESTSTYLSSLTGGLLKEHSGIQGSTIGFCSAGISASWDGKVSVAVYAPFATCYADRQEHAFFRVSVKARTVKRHGFEAWSLPLITDSKTRFRLILLRPKHIGSMLEMRQKMTPKLLQKLLNDLNAQEENEHRILLPFFSLNLDEDLWQRWSSQFRSPFASINTDVPPFPPMANIWHRAAFSLTNDGVGVSYRTVKNRALPTSVKAYCDNPKFVRSVPNYSLRLDSPFIFLVTLEDAKGIPLLSGSYAGSPVAGIKRVSIPIPPRIAAKPPPTSERKKKKKKSKDQLRKELRKQSQRRKFWDKIKGIFKMRKSTEKSEKGRKSEKMKRGEISQKSAKSRKEKRSQKSKKERKSQKSEKSKKKQKSEKSKKEKKSQKSEKTEKKRKAKGTWV